jgi:NAD(P)-dependent dehydrogenase (short-subunit alcohol dehydrogenase family)
MIEIPVLRRCIGSKTFGIEAHEAPTDAFPLQPSQKDGLGRMCRSHWTDYTNALRKAALARKASEGGAAVEAAPHGVRVNAVAPSLAMHPFLAKVTTDELLAELTEREAFGRYAEPWEIANVMVFLASDYSSYLTGEIISASSQRA